MIDFILDHIFEISIYAFVLCSTLYWHKKGFLRLAVSFGTLIITLSLSNFMLPYASDMIRQYSNVDEDISREIFNGISIEDDAAIENDISRQGELIYALKLPKQIKEVLSENNNQNAWQKLGVNHFSEYITQYISKIIVSILSFIFVFAFVWILIKIVMVSSDFISHIPIVSGINEIAGAVGGFIYAILIVSLLFLFLGVAGNTTWGRELIVIIERSPVLSFLYDMNIIAFVLKGIIFAI